MLSICYLQMHLDQEGDIYRLTVLWTLIMPVIVYLDALKLVYSYISTSHLLSYIPRVKIL